MSDEPKRNKKPLAIIAVVLVLGGLVAAWLFLKRAPTPNQAPIAALRLDSIDETNRVATLSDGGSHDADGTLQSWRIAWGDGKEETLSSMPQKAVHTYTSEGEYTVSLWCVDNLGATSSPPAMTNITFDFLKRQKALELAQAEATDRLKQEEARKQAEAQREADRLKQEEARKQAERLEQERQKQKELAALEAQKAKEQQELEAKRKAEAELAQQKAKEAATPSLAAALPDNPASRTVIYTPLGYTIGEFQICKEATAGQGKDGTLQVILVTRCVNFPHTAVPTANWQIDGKEFHLQAGRIRAALSPGRHEVTAFFRPKSDLQPNEIKAEVTVETTGECVVSPRK
jgi:flagellar motor protein MotB